MEKNIEAIAGFMRGLRGLDSWVFRSFCGLKDLKA